MARTIAISYIGGKGEVLGDGRFPHRCSDGAAYHGASPTGKKVSYELLAGERAAWSKGAVQHAQNMVSRYIDRAASGEPDPGIMRA